MEKLEWQVWFHGALSRPAAEALMKEDGDFLVRRSASDLSQFVLTGMQGGLVHHLLLVDSQGRVSSPLLLSVGRDERDFPLLT